MVNPAIQDSPDNGDNPAHPDIQLPHAPSNTKNANNAPPDLPVNPESRDQWASPANPDSQDNPAKAAAKAHLDQPVPKASRDSPDSPEAKDRPDNLGHPDKATKLCPDQKEHPAHRDIPESLAQLGNQADPAANAHPAQGERQDSLANPAVPDNPANGDNPEFREAMPNIVRAHLATRPTQRPNPLPPIRQRQLSKCPNHKCQRKACPRHNQVNHSLKQARHRHRHT